MIPPLPVSDEEFDGLMNRIPWEACPSRLAVGVSGGADSLCLAWLLHRWGKKTGRKICALTVHHDLACFPDEAVFSASLTQTWGLDPICLPLASSLPKTGFQEAARLGRYESLATWCHGESVPALIVAHHLDDQRETFCLRLGENSGSLGLAGMQMRQEIWGLQVVRPLLSVPKDRLEATLQAAQIPWISDPSNQSSAYARNRIRQKLANLPKDVLWFWDQEIKRLGRHRASFDQAVAQLFRDSSGVLMFPGYALLHWEAFEAASHELQRGLLQQLLFRLGGVSKHPSRRESFDRALSVLSRPTSGRLTLGGCLLEKRRPRDRGKHSWDLWIFREWQRISPQIWPADKKRLLWDGRFLLERTNPEKARWVKPQGGPAGGSPQAYAALPIFYPEEQVRWIHQQSDFVTQKNFLQTFLPP